MNSYILSDAIIRWAVLSYMCQWAGGLTTSLVTLRHYTMPTFLLIYQCTSTQPTRSFSYSNRSVYLWKCDSNFILATSQLAILSPAWNSCYIAHSGSAFYVTSNLWRDWYKLAINVVIVKVFHVISDFVCKYIYTHIYTYNIYSLHLAGLIPHKC